MAKQGESINGKIAIALDDDKRARLSRRRGKKVVGFMLLALFSFGRSF